MTLSTAKKLKSAGWDKGARNIFCNYFITSFGADRTSSSLYGSRGSLARCEMQILDEENSRLLQQKAMISGAGDFEYYPCPSTDELLAELNKVTLTKVGNNYSAIYFGDSPMDCRSVEDLTDPTECLALLWIKLKQENIGG